MYNLSEEDVFNLRAVFDTITGAHDIEIAQVYDIFTFMVRFSLFM
jgi:hypothetical protein